MMGQADIVAAPFAVRPTAVGIYIAHHGVRWDFFARPHGSTGGVALTAVFLRAPLLVPELRISHGTLPHHF